MELFDQNDIEELLFEKLSNEFSSSFAEYMFETWPEIIDDIGREIIVQSEKLINYALKEILKRASQLKRLELQKEVANVSN